MKRIAPILVLLFMFCYISGQGLKFEKPLENTINYFDVEKSNTTRNIKFHVLYSAHLSFTEYILPAPVGFTLAVSKKWGGYISGGFRYDAFIPEYLTGGLLLNVNPIINIYTGAGKMGVTYGFNGRGPRLGFESGTLLTLNFLSIQAGLGCSIYNFGPYQYGARGVEFQ